MSKAILNPTPTIIINADDFGLTESCNENISASFAHAIITSATLMANMPFFKEACQLARDNDFDKHLGLHFNLSYGSPLSSSIKRIKKVCDSNGQFNFGLARHAIFLPKATQHAILKELEQQWQACLDNGIQPTHIDSHQHIHNIIPIARIVATFAAKQGVPVRLARNVGKNVNTMKSIFKSILNAQITRHAPTPVRYACTPMDLLDGVAPINGTTEIICHPIKLADGSLGDAYLPHGVSLVSVINAAYPNANKVSYSHFSG